MPNVYISPTGAGNHSGSDMANAAVLGNLDAMIRKAGPGGNVLLIADQGSYRATGPVNISAGGAAGAAVTIKGVDSKGAAMPAVIEGTRPALYAAGNASGNELFKLQAGAANLKFDNLQVNNTGTVFRAAADVANITIDHVKSHNVARFFEDLAGGSNKTATITNLTIRHVDVTGFSKGVVHLRDHSSNIVIEDVRGDSQRQDGDHFAIGVHVEGGAHDVVVRRTTMANATDSEGSGYWNGDGFATERGTYNIRFENTVSRGNTDAGYDLKSTATTLVHALADDNTRNFRIWGETTIIDSTGTDPHKRGGSSSQAQVWVAAGATLTVKNSHFSDSGSATTVFANNGTVVLSGGSVELASAGHLVVGNALSGTTAVTSVAATGLWTLAGSVAKTIALTSPSVAAETAAAPSQLQFKSSSADEQSRGTGGVDTFYFDQHQKQGHDAIHAFGANDEVLTAVALTDGNGDGIIGFGSKGYLDLGSGAGSVTIDDVAGHTVTALAFAGERTIGDLHYFVYGLPDHGGPALVNG